MKKRIPTAKEEINSKLSLLTSKVSIDVRKKLARCYIVLCGSETGTLRKLERKYLENLETLCWRRMEKIKWSEKVTNEQVLERIEEKRTLLNAILHRKGNLIGHIPRRNCLLHDVIAGQMTEINGLGRRTAPG